MITEDYVSFEVAKLLKDKGFDEGCRTHYGGDGSFSYEKYEVEASGCEMHNAILAPTLQMAMKWLREMHNIFIFVEPHTYDYINEKNSSYVFSIWLGDNYYENPLTKDFPSYEETCEMAIKYCLENLI